MDDLVGSKLIIQYLGVCTGSSILVKIVAPITTLTVAEVVTDHSLQYLMNNKLLGVTESYKLSYPDLSKMSLKMQTDMFKELAKIRSDNPSGGVVTLLSKQLYKEALIGGFSEGAGGFLGGLYGGIFGRTK